MWVAGAALAAGGAAGVVLGSAGLMPAVDVEVAFPAVEAREYRPGSVTASEAGYEIALVYLGSSTCGWSNLPEVSRAVKDAKRLVAGRARDAGMRFSAVGIALDADASLGWGHLRKAGRFDEVSTGMGWANSGADKYVFGALAGPASTPQLLVVERLVNTGPDGRRKVESERVLARKGGRDRDHELGVAGRGVRKPPRPIRGASESGVTSAPDTPLPGD